MDRTRPSGPDRSHDLRCPRELALFSERQQLTLRPLGLDPSALLISSPKRMRVTRVQVLRPPFPWRCPLSRNPIFLPPARQRGHLLPGLWCLDVSRSWRPRRRELRRHNAVTPGLMGLDNNHGVSLSPLDIFRAPSACCCFFFLSLTPAGL